jgi:hypothetical protein
MTRDDLISDAYRGEQVRLHAAPKGYGGRGDKWAAAVIELAARFQARSLLDYGAGQGALGRAVRAAGLAIAEYDPARPGLDALPAPADLVVCTDVLEHIEPDRLAAVLAHLRAVTQRVLFAVVATRPATKWLSDGRNAHLLLHDAVWWTETMIMAGFCGLGPVPVSPLKKPAREVVLLLAPDSGVETSPQEPR